ncbi:hypothetical protein LXM94_22185 [Rhizobium sp. TRM95111]|uniref:hypothetical protein n=1 Tax=Rhizobium alarense TaxID=2846851 RepID=UPI001F3C9995|nr:hypothetical protein [Rhizobium alarense]MCF3642683.1 hypothetical protein [Rhizobium alarense]
MQQHAKAVKGLARRRYGPAAIVSAMSVLVLPGAAFAHVSERGLVMLLPTGFYMIGGALAVIASFAALAILPDRWFQALMRAEFPLAAWQAGPRHATSTLAFLFLALLVATGLFGTTDPLENLLPLTIWSIWWVVFTLTQAVVGNLWPWFNPWTGPLALLRRLTGGGVGRAPLMRLPAGVGYVPAIILFLVFAWYELVSLAPQDPRELAVAAALYWALNLVAMVLFGGGFWLRRGEAFSVFFRLVGMLAPLVVVRRTGMAGKRVLALVWPGRQCLATPALPPSGILFVLVTLGSVSFDGFSSTFLWLGALGVNPLEFPGRSVVLVPNTLGLLGACITLSTLFLASVAFGNGLAGRRDGAALAETAGKLIYSIIPISVAFHASHYLTILLVNGQYFLAALSDPFAVGWDLFGTRDLHVTNSFMNTLDGVRMIWTAQTVVVVTGHVVGILLAHMIAIRHFGTTASATRSQLFLAAVMVFYTVFGLWLLSTPVA